MRELAFLGDNCCLSDNLVQATLPRSGSPWRCLSVKGVLLETRLICHVYPTWSAQPHGGLGYGPVKNVLGFTPLVKQKKVSYIVVTKTHGDWGNPEALA